MDTRLHVAGIHFDHSIHIAKGIGCTERHGLAAGTGCGSIAAE
jgi:hypothetical protein